MTFVRIFVDSDADLQLETAPEGVRTFQLNTNPPELYFQRIPDFVAFQIQNISESFGNPEGVSICLAWNHPFFDLFAGLAKANNWGLYTQFPHEAANSLDPTSETPTSETPIRAASDRYGSSTGRNSLWDNSHPVGDPGRLDLIESTVDDMCAGVSDTALDFFSLTPFEIRAASTRGFSHRYSGAPRQDSYAIHSSEDWLVCAVADGVSQGRFSHIAAEVAARASVRLLTRTIGKPWADPVANFDGEDFVRRLNETIVREARHRQIFKVPEGATEEELTSQVRRQMASTLIVCAVSRVLHDRKAEVILLNVAGDCSGFMLDKKGFNKIGGGKQIDAPIHDTSVRPLPGNVKITETFTELDGGCAIVLVSDGIGDPFGEGDSSAAKYSAGFLQTPPRPADLFELINFKQRSFDDDRTMVGIWLSP
jgi:serine/threonine protein phosphatase PrpC